MQWLGASLDELIPADHRVRLVWRYVEGLDLSALYDQIQAVQGGPGRNPVDPRILMALWIFATLESISSARQIDRLCERDLAYRWICGEVSVNYHLISDFRTAHGEFLDQLLTDTIATLMHQGLVTLETVAQDGMRVRADAGSSSFRREPTLKTCQDQARQRVEQLRREREDEARRTDGDARREAAQQRSAREREERIEQALENLVELQQQKEAKKKGSGSQARCSTTDPEARIMKMGDGGFRPAYNVQFATDGDTRLIVSVDVTNSGSDRGQLAAMHEDVCRRYDKVPDDYLVDGGFATKEDITTVEQAGSQVFAPLHAQERMKNKGTDPYERKRGDSDEFAAFRARMATDEAKAKYKQRPAIAEFPNAECRNRGLHQFAVRGLEKVRAVSLWYAVTFNLMRMWDLKAV